MRLFYFRIAYLLSGMAIVCIGCLTEISLDVPRGNEQTLVIRGRALAGEEPQVAVEISYLSDFIKFEIPEWVNDAQVELLDESGQSLVIPLKEDGLYELDLADAEQGLTLQPGKAYQLSVQMSDGKRYLSSLEPLHPVPIPSDVTYVEDRRAEKNQAGNIVDQTYLRFLINTPLTQAGLTGRAHLRWTFLSTFKFTESTVVADMAPQSKVCYITENLNLENAVVYNGEENSRDELSGFYLLEEPLDYRFSEGFYLSVFQESLSAGAYEYWKNIREVASLSGTFFDAPPGKVQGNFSNPDDPAEEVLGYFYATQQQILRYYIPPDFRNVPSFCPALVRPEETSIFPTCVNCLLRVGSTLVKPDFWDP